MYRSKRRFVLLLAASIIFFNCTNHPSETSSIPVSDTKNSQPMAIKPLEIDKGEEEGIGADIRLSLIEKQQNDSFHFYKAVSSYNGKNIGLLIAVPKKMGDKGFTRGFSLSSIGKESDNLLQTLAALYKQKPDTSLQFIHSITLTCVNLNELAKTLGRDNNDYRAVNQYKLFFESLEGDQYAELYVNINPDENWIELREKDEEYRPALIKFLKQ